ncbi:MAG TPA: histidinol-phosphate transaminase [Acidimicrobiia bacterium]
MTGRHRIEPRDDLRALEGYHSPQLDVSVRLNTNESPFPPPPAFVDAWLGELATAPLHRYPDRAARELRDAIGASIGQPPARVFCANGSNEVLQTLLLTYGGPGRRVLVFEPTYALHSHIARLTGTEVVVGARRDDFGVDPDAARTLIERHQPEVVFLCSPNNPSGTVESRETIEAILDVAPGLVVVDEAYGEFARDSALDLADDERALVVTRTYSKVWSLAALRLGFCIAPPWVVAELDKVVLPYHLDVSTQLAGITALRFRAEMEARVAYLVEERERLFTALDELDGVTVFPSGANFLLLRVDRTGAGDDGTGHAVWQDLVERGILVRDFSRWPGVEDCLRVTVGTAQENTAFLSALKRVLREHGPR